MNDNVHFQQANCSIEENGPASAPTLPSHGPQISPKGKPMNTDDHSITAAAAATKTDQVLVLARQLSTATRRETDLLEGTSNAVSADDTIAEIFLYDAAKDARDEISALRGMLAVIKATSLCGAGVQVMEAIGLVDVIRDQVPGGNMTGTVDRDFRLLIRLLFSILDVIDGMSDGKISEEFDLLSNPQCNPWKPVENRIAAARSQP